MSDQRTSAPGRNDVARCHKCGAPKSCVTCGSPIVAADMVTRHIAERCLAYHAPRCLPPSELDAWLRWDGDPDPDQHLFLISEAGIQDECGCRALGCRLRIWPDRYGQLSGDEEGRIWAEGGNPFTVLVEQSPPRWVQRLSFRWWDERPMALVRLWVLRLHADRWS